VKRPNFSLETIMKIVKHIAPRRVATHAKVFTVRHAKRVVKNFMHRDIAIVAGVLILLVIARMLLHQFEMIEHRLDNVEHATTVLEVIHIAIRDGERAA
jgi:hypothetical protein